MMTGCDGGIEARLLPQARRTEVEIRMRRKREAGDLGELGSGGSWQMDWMSLKEEQEKLRDRARSRVTDERGVDWTRFGDLNHGGHIVERIVSGEEGKLLGREGMVFGNNRVESERD